MESHSIQKVLLISARSKCTSYTVSEFIKEEMEVGDEGDDLSLSVGRVGELGHTAS